MKFRFACLCAVWMLGAAAQAYAAEVLHTAYVTRVYPQADGEIRLSFSSEHPNCTNTATPKWYFIKVGQNGVTADGLRAMHATALTALAMERRLTIAFDDSLSGCYINRLQILEP